MGCSALSIDHTRISGCHRSSQFWDCSGLSFGRLFGAHLVHKTLQVGCLRATERNLNDSKQMKCGVYEQGRKISKPPVVIAMRVNVEAETTQAGLKEIFRNKAA